MERAFTEQNSEIVTNNNNNGTMPSDKIEKLIKLQLLKYSRRRRLKSKTGFYLEIRDDGSVMGTKDPKSPYTALQVMSIGSDMLAIWGTEAELYLSAGVDGNLKTSGHEGRQCVFIESLGPDFFSIYESYHSVYVGEPRCLIVNERGELELNEQGVLPGDNGHFMWEIN
ncbi:fibroblast growth factor 12-like [Rhopilema esculentum]|uniref:fibroblast growth factor 12-like n=1 Tax=Rhopilema esculentum TaxID=499914 RepID=UPI0031D583CE|eukprot:gene17382-8977_t